MLRLVEFALFLTPFALFIIWRAVGKRSGPPPLGLVVGAGCVLLALAGALVWLSEDRALPPDAAYAPARLENGRIVAGHAARPMTGLPSFLAEPALAAVMATLPEARVVGGAVRDALAGRPITDIDLATPRTPEQVTKALQEAGIRVVPTGIDHGTVTAVLGERSFEITTLRRDIETDGRHAVVAFTDDWRTDAARRDFTINAMSMARDGEVFDYFGGIADLRAGIVRFVGDPATRIAEDHLRILRYFRFFARYSFGPADAAALAAIRAGASGLGTLSAERVWSELSRILAVPDPRGAVALMAELGVLDAVVSEGADAARLARLVEAGAPADPLLRLSALLTGDARALAARLRLAGWERDRLLALRGGPVPRPDGDDAALRRLLADEDRPC